MNRLRTLVLAGVLVVASRQAPLAANTTAAVDDALVMVIMRSFMGRGAGNGFVIGDGTLVVTAHHLVFGGSRKGRHQEAGLISVVSPYIGDGCEASIVAADEELDLAMLKIPWAGHPALKLANEADLVFAERLVVTGIPQAVRSLGRGGTRPMPESLDRQSENLAVDYVAVRRQVPRFISLAGKGQLGDGWSGSPILLPDSAVVAGCFTALNTTRGLQRVRARGPAVTQVGRLLEKNDARRSLEPVDTSLPRPDDASEALLSFVKAYRHYVEDQYGRASDRIEEFIGMRPESSFAYVLSASNADGRKDHELADQHYRKAIDLNPETPGLQFYYAQFLSSRNPDKALEVAQGIWRFDALKPSAAMLMFNILVERDQYERAGELLSEALKLNSRNAYLRMGLGGCQYKLDRPDEAIANYIEAVELLPERGPFRGRLAYLLEQVGRLDEAEKHFRELLNVEPNNPVVHLWLAEFLSKHRPEARAEALKVARTALEMPARRGLPKERIEQLIEKLRLDDQPVP